MTRVAKYPQVIPPKFSAKRQTERPPKSAPWHCARTAPMRAFVILLAAGSTHGFLVPSPALVGHRGTEAARQLVGCAAEKRLRRHSSPRLSEPEREWQAPPGLEPDAIVLLWYYGCINLVRDCAYRFQISGLPFKKLNELGWDFPALSQAAPILHLLHVLHVPTR